MGNMSKNLAQHTLGHRNCPACNGAIEMQDSELSPLMTFAEAFDVWIAQRVIKNAGIWTNARYISDRTERDLRQYARSAGKFFGSLRLEEIHIGHLRQYQQARAINLIKVASVQGACDTHPWEQPAGANLIRKEVGTVMRVMRSAGAWTKHHEEVYEPLASVNSDVPRAMSPEEQHRWLHVASSREQWQTVHQWSLVALQTTAATNEMRALRFGDIFLSQGTIQVRNEGAKNKFRIRTIPLQTPEIVWALNGLMERARAMGANGPQCYLFPFHLTANRYDPLRPMTVWGLRKHWEEVRAAAGLEWLRIYDLRHTAITRMAEAGVPIHVIMSFAGHISPRMQQHYTAISMEAKRRWAVAAWAGGEMPFTPASDRWESDNSPSSTPRFGPQPARPDGSQPNAVGWR